MEKLTITMAMTSKARRAAIESGTLEQLRELLATNTGLSRAERSNAEGRIYRLTHAPKSRARESGGHLA